MDKNNAELRGIWMRLDNRKLLLKLMAIQGVSARTLAAKAGWKSHSYMNRLLRGEVNTLEVEPAVRIAEFLQVGVDDLFMPRTSSDAGRTPKGRGRAA
jgi:transcriptional regulator with XRE-family HTH domain